MALSSELSFGWEFSQLPQPPQVFSVRGFEALVPHTGTLRCRVCLAPQLFLPVYLHANGDHMVHQLSPCPPWSSSYCLATSPLHSSCPSPPLLPVWMVDSLVVRLLYSSDSSGWFLFLNLFLPFFWLWEEAQFSFLPIS